MEEELGLRVQVGDQFMTLNHAYTHFRITLHVFLCTLNSTGQVPQCLECSAWRWVRPEELDGLPLSAADRRIAVRIAQTGLPSGADDPLQEPAPAWKGGAVRAPSSER